MSGTKEKLYESSSDILYDSNYFVHAAIRRDLPLLQKALETFDASDATHRHNLTAYLTIHIDAVVAHHENEDHIYYPFLKEKGCPIPEILTREHTSLATVIDDMKEAVSFLHPNNTAAVERQLLEAVDTLKRVLAQYTELVSSHLGNEERATNEFVLKHISKHELKAVVDRIVIKEVADAKARGSDMAVRFCWMVSADPVHASELLKECPLMLRFLYWSVWTSSYEKIYANMLTAIILKDSALSAPSGCLGGNSACAIM